MMKETNYYLKICTTFKIEKIYIQINCKLKLRYLILKKNVLQYKNKN